MIVLLPKLKINIVCIPSARTIKHPQHPFFSALLRIFCYCSIDLFTCVFFKVADRSTDPVSGTATYDQVYMVAHDHPRMDI